VSPLKVKAIDVASAVALLHANQSQLLQLLDDALHRAGRQAATLCERRNTGPSSLALAVTPISQTQKH